MQRSSVLAIACCLIIAELNVGCAADIDDVRPQAEPEALSIAGIPLPGLQSCPSGYLAPGFWPPIDPVALLAGAASDCTVGTNRSPCAPHHVYTPSPVRVREPLFVLLPGTNMEPDKHDLVLSMAASTGYRTIGLSYDNTVSVEDACAGLETCGLDCAGLVRGEAVRGVDLTPQVAVARGDSVLVRLYRLLEQLDAIDPTGGWSSYYVPAVGSITPDNIVWANIIIAGFSQGAGHAAWISRQRQVHGLFILDGADDTCLDPATGDELPAEWLTTGLDASAGRPKYGYRHDHGTGDTSTTASWQSLGLGIPLVNADVLDRVPPPHATVTEQGHPAMPKICSDHMSMARDECMPTDLAGMTAATAAADAMLFNAYVSRLCYACDSTTCP
jgi:hypothetical protein